MKNHLVLFSPNEDVQRAIRFCKWAHGKQKRKYIGEPYYNHCFEVASITMLRADVSPEPTIIALLHDVLEDTAVHRDRIGEAFGARVLEGVELLTESPCFEESGLNRAARKRQTIERLREAPRYIKAIKLADIISNTPSIVKYDPKFAGLYIQEVRALLPALSEGDKVLYALCGKILSEGFKDLYPPDTRKAELLANNYIVFRKRAETTTNEAYRAESLAEAERAAKQYEEIMGYPLRLFNTSTGTVV